MSLPLVIAGPILRRVEPRSVSVWVALSQQVDVTFTVWSGMQMAGDEAGTVAPPSDPVGEASASTKHFGENLHVAVVTLEPEAPTPALTPQQIHSYDLAFTGPSLNSGLREAGLLKDETEDDRIDGVEGSATDAPFHKALGYDENQLPSFVTPAGNIADLRLAHASCRKPHGPADDAMAYLDDELQAKRFDTEERIQQLVLTGDQIYADDVASLLLPVLHELGEELLGGEERLEAGEDGTKVPAALENFPATRRQKLVQEQAGFTSGEASDHLLSFGEYAAMYCLVWSSRVWRTLPSADVVVPGFPPSAHSAVADDLTDHEGCADSDEDVTDTLREEVDKLRDRVTFFRSQVPRVQRVLANCATYMIFDDHEVTDDWNLNASWVNRVRAKPLGRNVVRNGVMAYVLFQGWGNDPERFREPDASDDEEHKEHELLSQIEAGFGGAGPYPRSGLDTAKVNQLVGVTHQPDKTARFHYTIDGPRHRIVVLDTRTKRGLPGQSLHPPKLLGDTLDEQVPKGPFTDGRELLVVVSPVPVLGPELIDTVGAGLARIVANVKYGYKAERNKLDKDCPEPGGHWGTEKYDAEAFSTDEEGMEALLGRLAPYGRAVILSGDVHYGCSIALDYWRKGESDPDRIVQLTSSPASNRFEELLEAVNRDSAVPQELLAGIMPERLAWKDEAKITVPEGEPIFPGRFARMKRKPALVPARTWPPGTTVDEDPDWRWRSRLLRDERSSSDRPGPDPPRFTGSFDENNPAPSFAAVASRHQMAVLDRNDHTRMVVFVPNVGVVEFDEQGGETSVVHSLLSTDGSGPVESGEPVPSGTGTPNTVHEASLAPMDVSAPELVVEA